MPLTAEEKRWAILALIAALFGAGLSLFLASQANIIWEEAHYRLAGRRLDWGYPDTPLGAPLFNRLSEFLFGTGLLGSRLLSWTLSALLPLAACFAALPLVSRLQAIQAGVLAAVIPPFVIAGAYAYPEGPLHLITLVFIGFFLRALNRDSWAMWLAAGTVCAIGAMYYYRFWFVPAGVAVFLLANWGGRKLWTNPRAWAAGAIAALGLSPSLIDNLLKDFGPILFQLSGRQDWAFWPRAALYPVEQAILVSPLILVLIAGAALIAWRRWRTGNRGAALVCYIAAANFIPFFLLAFFDRDYLPHWAFLSYLPLLAFMPAALESLAKPLKFKGARLALWSATLALALGFTGVFASTIFIWRHSQSLLSENAQGGLTGGDLEDWSRLEDPRPNDEMALAVGDHITAVQLQIAAGMGGRVYVLDHPEDASRNFQGYRRLRGEGEADLIAREAGAPVMVALREPPYLYREAERVALRARLCGIFDNVIRLDMQTLPPGRKRISFFSAQVRDAPIADPDLGDCAFFPSGVIEQPISGGTVSGLIPVYGAAAHRDGVSHVEIRLNGAPIARDDSLIDLPGYRFPEALAFDPDYPDVYWDVRADLTGVEPGRHQLSLLVVTQNGETILADERPIYVR